MYTDLPIFRAACLFANANLEEIDFFPPFLLFVFPSLAPFVLVNNAIYIYSTENIR